MCFIFYDNLMSIIIIEKFNKSRMVHMENSILLLSYIDHVPNKGIQDLM